MFCWSSNKVNFQTHLVSQPTELDRHGLKAQEEYMSPLLVHRSRPLHQHKITWRLDAQQSLKICSVRAFSSVAGPRACWNSLPINVRSVSFRKLLNTFLFQRAYSQLNSCFNVVRRTCSITCVRRLKFVMFTLQCITCQGWCHYTLLNSGITTSLALSSII